MHVNLAESSCYFQYHLNCRINTVHFQASVVTYNSFQSYLLQTILYIILSKEDNVEMKWYTSALAVANIRTGLEVNADQAMYVVMSRL